MATTQEDTKNTETLTPNDLCLKFKEYKQSRDTYRTEQINMKELEEDLKKSGKLDSFCEKSKMFLESSTNESGNDDDDMLMNILTLLVNLSDKESEFAEILSKKDEYLKTLVLTLIKLEGKTSVMLQRLVLSLLHNLSMYDQNLQRMRESCCIFAAKLYLSSENDTIRLLSLAIVADLANEKDSQGVLIKSTENDILMKQIKTALHNRARRTAEGWSVVELTRVLRKLANNDCNKRLLVQEDAVPVLLEICQRYRKEEQLEAVNALWTLSFDEENKADMMKNKTWEVEDTLQKLSKSTDERIKNICISTLWNLGKDKVGNSNGKTQRTRSSGCQIMISYPWAHQKTVKRVVEGLRQKGFSLWMDIDEMFGSTIEAMATAVEQSDIFIMCYSEYYKKSNNCRAEAEYAFAKGKTIVPVKMENNYSADGWLGIIIGTKLYYNLNERVEFDEAIENLSTGLLRHLRDANIEPKTNVTPSVTSTSEQTEGQLVIKAHKFTDIRNWTSADVDQWLENNALQEEFQGKLRGKDVAFLCLQEEVESNFDLYNYLKQKIEHEDLTKHTDMYFAVRDLVHPK